MLALGAAAQVFALANRLAGKTLYEVSFLSRDGQALTLTEGVDFPVSGNLSQVRPGDHVLLLSDGVERFADARLFCAELARLAPHLPLIAGLGTAAWWLASAGLLDGYRATIQWQHAVPFAERFPAVLLSQHVFELDRQRFTCGGGAALLDGLLTLIGRQHGNALIEDIAGALCMERIRPNEARQRVPLMVRLGEKQPRVTEAVMLMEANLEEPLTTDELARLTGQSRRQLERLFKQHLDMAPTRYYLQLRLEHARHLLRTTGKSIIQIGLLCGFSSGAHFSTVYRGHFNMAPREERFAGSARALAISTPEVG